MATPVDGPDAFIRLTWGSTFDYASWLDLEYNTVVATAEGGSLFFTGGGLSDSLWFNFDGGYDTEPKVGCISVNTLNSKYIPFLIGKAINPGGQGLPPSPPDPAGRYMIPASPISIDSDLVNTGFKAVDLAPFPAYWYYNIDSVEGFEAQ